MGPLACYAQWTMETAIGNLGKEIRQHKDPYRNLEERGVLRAQLNSIKALYPDLPIGSVDPNKLPGNARCFSNGYALLPRREETRKPLTRSQYNALMVYWEQQNWPNRNTWHNAIARWARLQLPNGQRARSVWYESGAKASLRKTSCVEVFSLFPFLKH
jgi:hypothetical protein